MPPSSPCSLPLVLLVLAVLIIPPVSAGVQTIWINPATGSDSNTGASAGQALATLRAGLDLVPKNTPLSTGYHFMLMPGHYREAALPDSGYVEGIRGTEQNPVILEASGGKHTAIIHGNLDLQKSSYLSLKNLDFVTDPGTGGGGNVLHLASADHILLSGCTISGYDGSVRQSQETLKANQVSGLVVEDCDIGGADWYALDFVAVHGGRITGSRIHDAGEFPLLVKGGSAGIQVDSNEIFNGRAGGISAGSGTGFNYFVSPWIHYDIYDTRFVNNLIHDNGVAVSVNGGYNILVAHNTLYRNRDFLEVMHGRRGCEGDTALCRQYIQAGGWGTTGSEEEYIPSANVIVYNNVMYNPAGKESPYRQFMVQGPVTPPSGSNVPSPSAADTNLRIQGNLVWNGGKDLPLLGDSAGCAESNPACNANQLARDNAINGKEPQFGAPDAGDYSLKESGSDAVALCQAIPPFPEIDRPQSPPVPKADPDNTVREDYYGTARGSTCVVGAVAGAPAGPRATRASGSGTSWPAGSGSGGAPAAGTPARGAALPAGLCIAACIAGLILSIKKKRVRINP